MGKYIITGGPGAGKTSLLNALKQRGFCCSEEVSRQLIIEESTRGSQCLPWIDLPAFAEKAFVRMLEAQQKVAEAEPVFFDRAVPDVIAYLEAAGLPVPDRYFNMLESCPYARIAFILPPWEAIYVNDSERWQTFAEAEHLYQQLFAVYERLGFELITLPKTSVEKRVEEVLKTLSLVPAQTTA